MKTLNSWLLIVAAVLLLSATTVLTACSALDATSGTGPSPAASNTQNPTPKPSGLAAARIDGLLGQIKVVPMGNYPTAMYFDFGDEEVRWNGSRSAISFWFRNSLNVLHPVLLYKTDYSVTIDNSVSSPTVELSYNSLDIFGDFTISKGTNYAWYLDRVNHAYVRMDQIDFDRGVWSPDGPTKARQ